jgi:hypothetical protein
MRSAVRSVEAELEDELGPDDLEELRRILRRLNSTTLVEDLRRRPLP